MIYGSFTPREMRARAAHARVALVVGHLAILGSVAYLFASLDGMSATPIVLVVVVIVGSTVWQSIAGTRWFHAVHDVAVARGRARFGGRWWLWSGLLPDTGGMVVPKLMMDDLLRAGDPPGKPSKLPAAYRTWWWVGVVAYVATQLLDVTNGVATVVVAGVVAVGVLTSLFLTLRVIGLLTERAIALRTNDPAPATTTYAS